MPFVYPFSRCIAEGAAAHTMRREKAVIGMKKQLAAVLALALAGLLGYAVGTAAAPAESGESAPIEAAAEAKEIPVPLYRLGASGGRLAVFLPGKSEPELVFDVWLHHLPDVDRERLQQGIEVFDEETLLALIEDYTS